MGPFKQGELDSLCGVYAVINAVAITQGRFSQAKRLALFHECLTYLEKKDSLADRISYDGVQLGELSKMLGIAAQYGIRHRKPFHHHPKTNLEKYWTTCQHFLQEPNRVVLLVIEGVYSHWTLTHRMTEKTMFCYDSSNLQRIHKRNCRTLHEEGTDAPHIFYPTHTFFIRSTL